MSSLASFRQPPAGSTKGEITTLVLLRRAFLVATPLVLAVVLWWHPAGGGNVYEDVRDDVGAWLFVHTAFLLFVPLLGLATYLLLNGLRGWAAAVSRVALIFFLVFYTAYEATVGVATGILVDHGNGLPAGEQAVVADAVQDLNRNPVLADPSISLVLGGAGWIVAMIAAAIAFRRAGAGWPLTLLIGAAALFAVHPPPIGPIALVCFATAAVLSERARAADTNAPVPSAPASAERAGTAL
jgi:hypothetical protein